jgi:hypothetical protein
MTFTCPNCKRAFQVEVFPFCCSCGCRCATRDDPGRMYDAAPPPSVGAELTGLLALLGCKYKPSCGCAGKSAVMDMWGVAGCRENRAQIIDWLKEAYDHTGLGERLVAGFWACVSRPLDLLLRLRGPDMFGNLLDEAIRRVELKQGLSYK